MTYYNEDQLYRYFEKAIEREESRRSEKLKKEINYLYHKEMKKISEELSLKKSLELSKKLKEVQINYQEQLNQIGMGFDEKLIAERTRLTKVIFDDVIEKLRKYVSSKKYEESMTEKIQEVMKQYPKVELHFYVASFDDKLKAILKKECSLQSCKIIDEPKVSLGGFLVLIGDRNIEIDQTIDNKFEEQKDWFFHNSKLFIRH